jgi:SulP family sulfate permease
MKNYLSGFTLNNVFAGFIVAVVALPLCIAFAIASGASPMSGIVSGVAGGFIAAALGSSRFQVSGPAAAFITLIFGVVSQHGMDVLLASTVAAGLVVLLIAGLRLGRMMELMPHSVLVGFTAGIGVLILLSQLPAALGIEAKGANIIEKLAFTFGHLEQAHYTELPVLGATLLAALAWKKTRLARWIPAPLVALIAGTAVGQALVATGNPVRTVGALYELSVTGLGVSAGFLATLAGHAQTVALTGFTLGVLIAVESLLSAKALDQMGGGKHDPDRELLGLGIANLAVPFIGGIPVSGVIVRGSTSVAGGATHRTAAMFHAAFLLLFVLLLFPAIKLLPMAALAAVLVLTALRLIEIHELHRILRIDRYEGALALLTVVLTVSIDLTVSVPVGVALMLVLALKRMLEDRRLDVVDQHGHTVVAINSSVTFLTASGLKREIEHHVRDDRVRALNLLDSHFIDATGALMIAELCRGEPRLEVWVRDQSGFDKLEHAGVEAARIRILGNRMVNLPEVFRHIEASPA